MFCRITAIAGEDGMSQYSRANNENHANFQFNFFTLLKKRKKKKKRSKRAQIYKKERTDMRSVFEA